MLLARGAEQDLEALRDCLEEFGSRASVDRVIDRMMDVIAGLSQFPERGSYLNELASLGIKDFRQTTFKPCRVIRRVVSHQVIIHLVADGRRDMRSLLERRLLVS